MGVGWVGAALAAALDAVLVATPARQLRPAAAGATAGYAGVGRMLWLRWKTLLGS
jgi:hypothetical protein